MDSDNWKKDTWTNKREGKVVKILRGITECLLIIYMFFLGFKFM